MLLHKHVKDLETLTTRKKQNEVLKTWQETISKMFHTQKPFDTDNKVIG